MDGTDSKASSFVSERLVVRVLAGIPIVLTEIAFFFIRSRHNLGRGIGLLRCDILYVTSSQR